MTRLFICIFAMLALIACTSDDRGLRVLAGSGAGPDEFSVMPMAPLVMPTDTANLPSPTPGAGNRADPAPLADAVVALGGNANALVPNGVPVRDGALVNAAGRNGVDPAIRQTLASEDAAFRNRRSSFGLFRGRAVKRSPLRTQRFAIADPVSVSFADATGTFAFMRAKPLMPTQS